MHSEKMKPTLKVLIIDGDTAARNGIASILNQAGFEIVNALDCVAGLRKLNETPHHLVILSQSLLDSGQTCFQIRELFNIPIIMLGSESGGEAWQRAVASGLMPIWRSPLTSLSW